MAKKKARKCPLCGTAMFALTRAKGPGFECPRCQHGEDRKKK